VRWLNLQPCEFCWGYFPTLGRKESEVNADEYNTRKSVDFRRCILSANGTPLAVFFGRAALILDSKNERKSIMKFPLQIKFHNMPPSLAVENNIRDKASKLNLFYDRITSCRVVVKAPHRHHRKGKIYEVHIDLTMPAGEVVINRSPKRLRTATSPVTDGLETHLTESHEPNRNGTHTDVYVAIRDAFNAAGRKLQDYARRQSGAVKLHPAEHRKIIRK